MSKHIAENVEKLALDIVEAWDMDTLMDYALTRESNKG